MIESRRMRWAGHVTCKGKTNKTYRGKTLGRPRCRWEKNIKLEIGEKGWSSIDWIDMTQNADHWRALANTAIKLQVSQHVGKFLSS
jgi:hypothetical protein